TNLQRIRLIEEVIEELRPYLRKDGGDCELVDVDGSNVLVNLSGACVGCQMAGVTISGIQERLIAKLGTPIRVVPKIVEVMLPFFTEQFGNPSSIHAFGASVGAAVKTARGQLQQLLGAAH